MKTFLPDEIEEIAEQLEIGLNCYWNILNGQLISVPNSDLIALDEGGAYQKDIEFIEENILEFKKIEKPSSHTAFVFMTDFIKTLPHSNIKSNLKNALDNKYPLRQFKHYIDRNDDYRNLWFEFKSHSMQEYVKNQIEEIIETENNSRLN